ncbi:MAG: rod shape-determining protein RodA [Verrucomicrobia bacterium]|jgi:rod shape determining protein RodA|nr:rod shape-determining protein RodA [Verrucomicrobiota bacterium]MBT7067185.1 rod shape-determining protein RodA [Verrucomicrobiota bacterium]MBT7699738.1 rod shape-determining protein RodA [Verrucomicrobiota bacterium]
MREFLRQFGMLRYMNWSMCLATLILLVLGILFVYSSCYISEDLPVRTLYKRQIMWAVAGIVSYVLFAATDYRSLRRWSWSIYAGCLLLLVAVLLVGTVREGAQRWLTILNFDIQPSEPAKLALVIILARRLGLPGMYYGEWRRLGGVLLLFLIPVLLILKQPDLGTAMVFAPITFIMMYAAGVPLRALGLLAAIALVAVGCLLGAVFLPEKLGASPETQARLTAMTGLSDYQRNRILVFVRANEDPLGAGWNKLQSEIAVGSGGLWGKGFRNGTQNILGFLPRTVAPNDFIYSVIAEETGFVGSMGVFTLFGMVFWGGMRAAMSARDKLGRLLCVGIVSLLFCHVFINIAMTVGLMPITGLPLPLLSYGGSFMMVVMSALGLMQSVHIRARRAIY